MTKWLEQASQWHEVCCHDLEVMSSNPSRVELGVLSTSVLSRTWTKNIYIKLFGEHSFFCYSRLYFICIIGTYTLRLTTFCWAFQWENKLLQRLLPSMLWDIACVEYWLLDSWLIILTAMNICHILVQFHYNNAYHEMRCTWGRTAQKSQ